LQAYIMKDKEQLAFWKHVHILDKI
jgi:hypothetical protein